MKWKRIGTAAGTLALAAATAGAAAGILGPRKSNRRNILRAEIERAGPRQFVRLPDPPSIEYQPPGSLLMTGIRPEPVMGNLVAILTMEGNLEIAIIDQPPSTVDWYYRNQNGSHGAELALALDLRNWRPEPGHNSELLQQVLDHCRWTKAGQRNRMSWKPYRIDLTMHNLVRPTPEEGWALCRDGTILTENAHSLNYPAHMIVQDGKGQYCPVERNVESATIEDRQSVLRRPIWQGETTPSWEEAVKQLYLRMNWHTKPATKREETEPEIFRQSQDAPAEAGPTP